MREVGVVERTSFQEGRSQIQDTVLPQISCGTLGKLCKLLSLSFLFGIFHVSFSESRIIGQISWSLVFVNKVYWGMTTHNYYILFMAAFGLP